MQIKQPFALLGLHFLLVTCARSGLSRTGFLSFISHKGLPLEKYCWRVSKTCAQWEPLQDVQQQTEQISCLRQSRKWFTSLAQPLWPLAQCWCLSVVYAQTCPQYCWGHCWLWPSCSRSLKPNRHSNKPLKQGVCKIKQPPIIETTTTQRRAKMSHQTKTCIYYAFLSCMVADGMIDIPLDVAEQAAQAWARLATFTA